MKNKRAACLTLALCVLLSVCTLAGCAAKEENMTSDDTVHGDVTGGGISSGDASAAGRMTVAVGGRTFAASLADTEAAAAFACMLPLTLSMSELNGNEKYHYLGESLPAAAQSVGRIEAGDVMLYGSSCVLIFYESFTTSYRYTRLGKIEDAEGLQAVVGTGSVTVTFSL